jgi:hypothetical protein
MRQVTNPICLEGNFLAFRPRLNLAEGTVVDRFVVFLPDTRAPLRYAAPEASNRSHGRHRPALPWKISQPPVVSAVDAA